MNLNKIFKALQDEAPGTFEKVDSRRGLLKSFGSKVAVAAVPVFAASMFKKAHAQTNNELIDAMNLVLKWEYLGYAFYSEILTNGPVFATLNGRAAFEAIMQQKENHIQSLKLVITNGGGIPIESPVFDITGGEGSGFGPFAESKTDYRKMLHLAQTLEDTTVRVQKGQIVKLMVNDVFLSSVLGIHSVSGRYAAQIRLMRREAGNLAVRPWITGTASEFDNAYLQSYYNGEGVTVQSGINVEGLNGETLTYATVTQAFDEPIDMVTAEERISPFVAP